MARLCKSCNKFCSVEQQEPEIEPEIEANEDGKSGQVAVSVRLVLVSGCCGDEVAESNQDIQLDFEHEHAAAVEIVGHSGDTGDRTEGKGRGLKTFYGANVSVDLKCTHEGCNPENKGPWEATLEEHVEEQASCFDEI